MNDDNLLPDIENDIFGNWEDIQKKIRNEETEKRVMNNEENIQRIDCPDFRQFYVRLLRIMQSWDGRTSTIDPVLIGDLYDILRMVFSGIDDWPNPMPDSFYKVWEIMCSPRNYKCDRNIRCEKCMKTYDIFYREHIIKFNPYADTPMNMEFERKVSRVSCPNCGYPIINYANRDVFGVFRSVHDGEKELNDFRGKFEHNFQG